MGKTRGGNNNQNSFIQGTIEKEANRDNVLEQFKKYEENNLSPENTEIVESILNETVSKFKTDLTGDEKTNLQDYTGSIYSAINSGLAQSSLIEELASKVKDLDSALSKLPTHEQLYFRKVSFQNSEKLEKFLEKHKPGNVVKYSAYTSTSREKGKYGFFGNKDNNARIYIYGSAHLIEKVSYYENEKEGLFKRGSQFKVEAVSKDKEGMNEIYLRQV